MSRTAEVFQSAMQKGAKTLKVNHFLGVTIWIWDTCLNLCVAYNSLCHVTVKKKQAKITFLNPRTARPSVEPAFAVIAWFCMTVLTIDRIHQKNLFIH